MEWQRDGRGERESGWCGLVQIENNEDGWGGGTMRKHSGTNSVELLREHHRLANEVGDSHLNNFQLEPEFKPRAYIFDRINAGRLHFEDAACPIATAII